VQDIAVSGGYWLACAGEKIYITKTSKVGSIGVLHQSLYGEEWCTQFLRYEGAFKSLNKAKLKEKLEPIDQIFIDHVRKSREQTIKEENFEQLFNGSTWIGQQAIEIGLADGVQSIDSFIRSTFGGPTKVNVFIYTWKLYKEGKLWQRPNDYFIYL